MEELGACKFLQGASVGKLGACKFPRGAFLFRRGRYSSVCFITLLSLFSYTHTYSNSDHRFIPHFPHFSHLDWV